MKRGGWRWKGRGGDRRGEGRDEMKKRGGEGRYEKKSMTELILTISFNYV